MISKAPPTSSGRSSVFLAVVKLVDMGMLQQVSIASVRIAKLIEVRIDHLPIFLGCFFGIVSHRL